MQLDKLTNKQKITFAVLVALVVVIIVIAAQKAKIEQETNKVIENSRVKTEGGETVFLPKPITDRIYKDLNAYLADPSIYVEVKNLENEELRILWKDWEKRYKKKYHGRSLADAILNGYTFSRNFGYAAWTRYAFPAYKKIKSIGLP